MGYKLVLFDLDGTLVDSVDAHAEGWAYAFKALGLAEVEKSLLAGLIGLPGGTIVEKILGREGLKHYKEIRRLKDRHFLKCVARRAVLLFPDVVPCLSYLKSRDYALGVATSTPNYILLPLLESLGVVDHFNVTVGGDEVERGKPSPDIFLRAAEKAGVSPRKVVVIGDTVYDTLPARSVGMLSVLVVRSGVLNAENLVADVVITSLSDLSAFL